MKFKEGGIEIIKHNNETKYCIYVIDKNVPKYLNSKGELVLWGKDKAGTSDYNKAKRILLRLLNV